VSDVMKALDAAMAAVLDALRAERDEAYERGKRDGQREPPPELIDRWFQNELADYRMVLRHCSETYDHFTEGRISKPNTLPREVFAVAEELAQERFAEMVKDEVEARTDALQADRDRLAEALRAALDWFNAHYPKIAGRGVALDDQGEDRAAAVWYEVARSGLIVMNAARAALGKDRNA
jgi:hypothetical protein